MGQEEERKKLAALALVLVSLFSTIFVLPVLHSPSTYMPTCARITLEREVSWTVCHLTQWLKESSGRPG